MQLSWWILVLAGVGIGVFASFTGLGGGFLVVPLLLWLGFASHQAVGTSALAILIGILSVVVAHYRLGNVDFRTGILLGLGGLIGAQLGAPLVSHISTETFKKLFAGLLVALAVYLLVKK